MSGELVAGLMGVLTGLAGLVGVPLEDFQANGDEGLNHNHSGHGHGEGFEGNFSLGSAHEHALFYLNVNGSEEELTGKEYQLQSRYVHLENFKPHIVHKHSENVTWRYFLDTINLEVENGCVRFKNRSSGCGNVSVVLNGDEIDSLDKEIKQGDNLAIMGPENEGIIKDYMEKKLPSEYTGRDPGLNI